MLLRRVQAPTLQEALAKVEKECGRGALLVETRRTAKGYLVVAAETVRLQRPRKPAPGPGGRRWTRGFRPLAERALEFGVAPSVLAAVEDAMLGTRVELGRIGDPAVPGVAARILQALVPTVDTASDLFRVTALVGPTGVGKTTTLAKLAAHAMREAGHRVAIVTVDTYRVAAVEQLRAYSDMLGVPCEVAFTPLDVERTLRRHADKDRVFIDTSGRSPFDDEALARARGVLGAARPACLLCLPAGMRRIDAEAAVAAFEPLAPEGVVLTKWDETRCPGAGLSLAIELGLRISHVTIGQEVPQDIVPARADELAATVFHLAHAAAEAP